MNQTSKNVLQRETQTTLLDERRNRQQQGNRNKSQCDVSQEYTSFQRRDEQPTTRAGRAKRTLMRICHVFSQNLAMAGVALKPPFCESRVKTMRRSDAGAAQIGRAWLGIVPGNLLPRDLREIVLIDICKTTHDVLCDQTKKSPQIVSHGHSRPNLSFIGGG